MAEPLSIHNKVHKAPKNLPYPKSRSAFSKLPTVQQLGCFQESAKTCQPSPAAYLLGMPALPQELCLGLALYFKGEAGVSSLIKKAFVSTLGIWKKMIWHHCFPEDARLCQPARISWPLQSNFQDS